MTTNDDRLVNSLSNLPTANYEIVTPEQAKTWLAECNRNNRAISASRVVPLAEDFASDNFVITHQGIAFGSDGQLYDGQHRLTALVRANVPAVLLVVRGLDPRAREVIDTGRARSIADNLRLNGHAHSAQLTAIANAICWLEWGRGLGSVRAVEAKIEQYKADFDWAETCLMRKEPLLRAPITSAMVYARQLNPPKLDDFVRAYLSGTGLGVDSPVYLLREFVTRHSKGSTNREVQLKALRAVEAFCDGVTMRKLYASEETLERVVGRLGRTARKFSTD